MFDASCTIKMVVKMMLPHKCWVPNSYWLLSNHVIKKKLLGVEQLLVAEESCDSTKQLLVAEEPSDSTKQLLVAG
jgi:hypothetical protein